MRERGRRVDRMAAQFILKRHLDVQRAEREDGDPERE
jgi:RNase H-fold protein (predicted Holliday junction resolvase)